MPAGKKKVKKSKKDKVKEKREKEETKQTPSVRLRPNSDFGQFLDVEFWGPRRVGLEGWEPRRVGAQGQNRLWSDFGHHYPTDFGQSDFGQR